MSTGKILLVDDEPDIVETAAFMLRIHGYTVYTASDGLECIEKARCDQPDIILLDIMMPGMDGYEVCRKLKTDNGTKHIPVIMLSAKDNDMTSRAADAYGADDYVIKPFDLPRLLDKLESYAGKQ